MKTGFFLTFNDGPGGIFSSQVIDVCQYLRKVSNRRFKLVSFISIRSFFTVRKKIKHLDPTAVVVPMFPGINLWRLNAISLRILYMYYRPDLILARGPFATALAISNTDADVCFDARGAYYSEFKEYDVANGKISAEQMKSLERKAILNCDRAIAVSQALVDYWKATYGYAGSKHVVIPCTLNSSYKFIEPVVTESIRIVFSGGNGPWQNLKSISDYLTTLLLKDARVEVILMTQILPEDFDLCDVFPGRVKHMWVEENKVAEVLATCDYGWLVRENTLTNAVASPVKFAEYLAAGLKVVISENLGDYSEYVVLNDCGIVLKSLEDLKELAKPDSFEKKRIQKLAMSNFTKSEFVDSYKAVLCE